MTDRARENPFAAAMCIAFFYVNPAPTAGTYRLVIAFNRDEALHRDTDPVKWMGGVLCGRDMTPGKEGGTWLGISRSGRVGMLTNISTGGFSVINAKGRGHLVVDYLEKDEFTAVEYLENIAGSTDQYSPFNLCLFEPRRDGSKVYDAHYYCRGAEGHSVKSEGPRPISSGVTGLSNHPYSRPFQKTAFGEIMMKQAVSDSAVVGEKTLLLSRLRALLKNNEEKYPDPQMSSQCGDDETLVRDLSSIFVSAPRRNYGTRMQTIILVDYEGNVTYEENTCTEKETDLWEKRVQEFRLQE